MLALALPLLALLRSASLTGGRGAQCAIINGTDISGANLKWEHKPQPFSSSDRLDHSRGNSFSI